MAEAKVTQKTIRVFTLELDEGEAHELLRALEGLSPWPFSKVSPTAATLRSALYPGRAVL
jgi:hypothetical protein